MYSGCWPGRPLDQLRSAAQDEPSRVGRRAGGARPSPALAAMDAHRFPPAVAAAAARAPAVRAHHSIKGSMLATASMLSLIHISEPTRLGMISYAVFCL